MADPDREMVAAELALGVLEGEERARAERLAADDPAFAALVEEWHERLAPLIEGLEPIAPSPDLWQRINAAIDSQGLRADNVVELHRAVRRWQGVSAAASAVAAALLIMVAVQPTLVGIGPAPRPAPVAKPKAPMLTATIMAEDRSAAFVVAVERDDGMMLVTPAMASRTPGHDHELWVIPDGGKPMSLGVIGADGPRRMAVSPPMMPMLAKGAMLAVSVEPVGGSPTGQPTGPVVGTGQLVAV